MSLLIDLNDPEIIGKIQELSPTPGYCILMDMVGSTALKGTEPRKWVSRIHDAFALAKAHLKEFLPLKTTGDALLYYIRDSELKSSGRTVGSLFLALCYIVQDKDEHVFGRTKIAVARCEHAYDVTFQKGVSDIYGKDIDLTARLLEVALEQEIIMNEPFAQQIQAEYKAAPQLSSPDVRRIVGPWQYDMKGFADLVSVYKLPAGGISLNQVMEPSEFDTWY